MQHELAGDIPIHVTSLYGAATRKPWVSLTVGASEIQIAPFKARMIAAWLIEAAEAATQDAFMVEWMETRVGVEPAQSVQILAEFRSWRKSQLEG